MAATPPTAAPISGPLFFPHSLPRPPAIPAADVRNIFAPVRSLWIESGIDTFIPPESPSTLIDNFMANNPHNRRDFLKGSLGLLVFSSVGGTTLYGRVFPKSYKQLPGNLVAATYTLLVDDYPSFEATIDSELGPVKIGLTEVGSSIKLGSPSENSELLLMNPDHCERSGRDGNFYPISLVRVKESGEDAFVAVSTWCPHNNKSQLAYFDHKLGNSGLFVCLQHEKSCFTADGTWVPPEDSPYTDAPTKDEFFFNLNPDGTPHLTRFSTTYNQADGTVTIHDILCECAPCPTNSAPDEESGAYGLEQNYPNPVRHSTIIRFSLPGAAHVLLTVLSTDGEEIGVVVDKKMEAGLHSVDFKAKDLPSGTYFYKLETSFGTKTRRMTVMH